MKKRALAKAVVVSLAVMAAVAMLHSVKTTAESPLYERMSLEGNGVLVRREDVEAVLGPPKVAYAVTDNAPCNAPCSGHIVHTFAPTFTWALFRVEPHLGTPPVMPPTPTPSPTPNLRWQEHAAGSYPPVAVKVAWGTYVETLEIAANGSTSGYNPNLDFHDAAYVACDGAGSSTRKAGAAPCFEAIYYDIDWNDKVGDQMWSWIYFWVRDPDFVAMKAVDVGDCPTDEWSYEYVNNGPKYSIGQVFSSIYNRVHGVSGFDVRYLHTAPV